MRAVLIAVSLVAAPAAAQDLPFSIAATEACLAATPGDAGCIGASATACIETPDGGSTVGMGSCLIREYEYWEARLAAVEPALIEQAREMDVYLDEIDSVAGRQTPALAKMQTAWRAYRDAYCDYEASRWGGGTGIGPAMAGCLMQLTGVQALMRESVAEQR